MRCSVGLTSVLGPVLCGCLLLSCDGSNAGSPVCPRARAAFALNLASDSGGLPSSLNVRVGFGGAAHESFSFYKGNKGNDVLCCVVGEPHGRSLHPQSCGTVLHSDAAAAGQVSARDASVASPLPGVEPGAEPSELHCQIWTNGAAALTVSAQNFETVERTLAAEADAAYPECEVWSTLQVPLVLERGDAGARRAAP